MRKKFQEIFKINDSGTLTPKKSVRIGSTIISPAVTFGRKAIFNGLNFFDVKGLDMEVEEKEGILVVKGFYNDKKEQQSE